MDWRVIPPSTVEIPPLVIEMRRDELMLTEPVPDVAIVPL